MRLVEVKAITEGHGLMLFSISLGNGTPSSYHGNVSIIDDTAVIDMHAGHQTVEPERMAGLVAYMRTQGYQLASHTSYVAQIMGTTWPGIRVNAVFHKMDL